MNYRIINAIPDYLTIKEQRWMWEELKKANSVENGIIAVSYNTNSDIMFKIKNIRFDLIDIEYINTAG